MLFFIIDGFDIKWATMTDIPFNKEANEGELHIL